MNKAYTAILVASVVLLVSACQQAPKEVPLIDTIPHTEQELIYNDLLAQPFVSTNISILGVRVGMTEDDVRAKLGEPDNATEFDFGAVKNLQYNTKLGINGSGVQYHVENRIVTRILVSEGMNKYLHGNSTVGKTKEQVYGLYGVPDRQYDLPRSQRFFVYNKEGFEVYLAKGTEYQYAFVYPNRKLPTMAYTTQNKTTQEILNPPLPTLLTDTTTLCNQGPTFGQNTVTKECQAFNNSCVIPDHWVEVERCGEANSTA